MKKEKNDKKVKKESHEERFFAYFKDKDISNRRRFKILNSKIIAMIIVFLLLLVGDTFNENSKFEEEEILTEPVPISQAFNKKGIWYLIPSGDGYPTYWSNILEFIVSDGSGNIVSYNVLGRARLRDFIGKPYEKQVELIEKFNFEVRKSLGYSRELRTSKPIFNLKKSFTRGNQEYEEMCYIPETAYIKQEDKNIIKTKYIDLSDMQINREIEGLYFNGLITYPDFLNHYNFLVTTTSKNHPGFILDSETSDRVYSDKTYQELDKIILEEYNKEN